MRAALIMTVGALVYAVSVGLAGADFLVTPLAVGLVVVAAGIVGSSRHLIPNGVVLIGWGLGVLAAEQVLPAGRETPAYMAGIAAGILGGRLFSRPAERSSWFAAAACTAAIASLLFYLAYDIHWLGGWKPWALFTLAWAGAEALRSVGSRGSPMLTNLDKRPATGGPGRRW